MSTLVSKNVQVGTSGTATDNFTIFQPATPDGTLRIGNGNTGITTSLLTLNSSGNLGLGVTPSAWFANGKAVQVGAGASLLGTTTASQMLVGANYFFNGSNNIYIASQAASYYQQSAGAHSWHNAPSGTAGNAISFTQAMTLDASGNLFLGRTSGSNPSGQTSVFQVGGGDDYLDFGRNAGLGAAQLTVSVSTSIARNVVSFRNTNGYVGNIQISGSATSYLTSSDYRLKNTITPMTGALAKVAALKPVTYKWNSDGSDGQGFIAHELAEVCPDAVSGAKDAVDPDGKPVYQGIDTSFLVATLTAALQELKAEFDAYKATHP